MTHTIEEKLYNDLHYQICNDLGVSQSDSSEFAAKMCVIIAKEYAASLNRQGCRWTKASEEEMPKEIGKLHWRDAISKEPMSAGFAYTRIKRGFANEVEYLDESIEPCATSSEWNYDKWSDVISEITKWFNADNSDERTRSQFIDEMIKKFPSPTGDRDCEELKLSYKLLTDQFEMLAEKLIKKEKDCEEKDRRISELEEENNKLIMLTKKLLK